MFLDLEEKFLDFFFNVFFYIIAKLCAAKIFFQKPNITGANLFPPHQG